MTGFGQEPFGTGPFGEVLEPVAPRPRVADWEIIPRNANLSRTLDPLSGWSRLELVERLNTPDTWTVTGPAQVMAPFAAAGMGCILSRDGEQISSGQVIDIEGDRQFDSNGRIVDTQTVVFASDLDALGDRILLPVPGQAVTPGTIFTFPLSHDARIASAEGLLLYYINFNLGGAARADRRLARLRIPTSLNRGPTTTFSARFDNLGVAVRDIAEFGNLQVRVVHTEDGGGAWLDVVVTQPADVSADIRFGSEQSTSAGLITGYSYKISKPSVTRPLVGLGGDLAAREFLELRDSTAEATWSRSVERFVDQTGIAPDSADKTGEATRAAQEALAEGAGPVSVSFVPTLGPDLEYRRDVKVGDIVGYDLPGLPPAKDKIRQATTAVSADSNQMTERVAVVVGTPDAPSTRSQRQVQRALRAVTAIQRSR